VEARAATSQLRELERQQLHAAQARIAELERERAALAERIRGIECIAGAHETWKAGFRDGLTAAAALVEQVNQPKGDE
jgi:crotonobetainyl-CoA:carnitine CoA-transferase CaiB-like acyl-CoA transferase